MKYKTLRLVAIVSLALSIVFFGGCIIQTIRLAKLEKSASADASDIKRMQSQIDELKKKLEEKEKQSNSSSAPAAAPQKFPYDAEKIQKNGPKVAYLTFDDGPSKNTPLLLKTLKNLNVHATFFVIGLNCQKYPDAIKQEAAEGHAIGIHSWTHKYSYIYANMTNFMQDFNQLNEYLTKQLGTAPNICRFPGGTNNTVSLFYNKDHIMKQIVQKVESMNVRPIDWNASANDAVSKVPTSKLIARRVVNQIGNQHQPVILLHDMGRSTNTINAIPLIVKKLRAQGYSFGILMAKTQAVMFQPS